MKSLLFIVIFLFVALTTNTAFAGPWHVNYQDQKMPSQSMIEHDTWTNPVAASASNIKLAAAISNSAATTITVFSAQPDVARNIQLTPTGTTANVGAGTAVVTGTNIFGKTISENFTIASTQSTATVGLKAFRTVSSVVFPQATGTGVTLNIGVGSKLGVRRCLTNAGDYVMSEFGGAYDATRGTLANSATAVESNTFVDNSAVDGAHNVDLFYVENFRCWPGQ